MKRTFFTIALMAMCISLNAQDVASLAFMYDGITNNTNNYYGTARSVAMGNAVTAVGGELGSVGINPAGSAVAKYSQFEITPGLTISSVNSQFSPIGEGLYQASSGETRTRFTLPSFGASFSFNTGNEYGVKSFSFGIVATQTQDYNKSFSARGLNSRTSLLGEFAAGAYGKTYKDLESYNSGTSWDLVAGYNGRLFGGVSDVVYAGNCETYTMLGYCIPSALSQTSMVTTTGYKRDLVLNFAFDIDSKVYMGFNIGFPMMYRNNQESYFETPVNYQDFFIGLPDKTGEAVDTYYTGSTYQFDQYTRMTGIYAKFGFIYLPTDHLRIGGAIQTPVAYNVTEGYHYMANSTYEYSGCNGYSSSPQDEWSYRERGPWSFNLGLAYTFGSMALLSLDYELTDFKSLYFSEIGNRTDYFYKVNQTIRNFCGSSHNLRAGLEVKLNPLVSARAGFTLQTTPERYWKEGGSVGVKAEDYYYNMAFYSGAHGKAQYFKDNKYSFSFGLGYSSPGSFFADVAARLNRYSASVFIPFYDYDHLDVDGGYHEVGTATEELSPRILNNGRLWDVMLTIGWRF